MPTGDGLLARLPQREPFAIATFAALCRAAGEFGSGIVEVTARGSIQVRGLTPHSAGSFAAAAASLGFEERPGPTVIANPLAGLDPLEVADVRALAAELRRRLTLFAGRLAPKVSVVVDGGGALSLDGLTADIRLRAATASRLNVGIAGDAATATWIGAVDGKDAVNAVLALLEVIAGYGPEARARDIVRRAGVNGFVAALGEWLFAAPPPKAGKPAIPIGRHRLRHGAVAIGVGLPFGQAEAALLGRLAIAVGDAGAKILVPAEGRTLLAIGFAEEDARGFTGDAERLGFIVRPDDPCRAIVACAGAPACASARIPTRRIAATIARAAGPMLDGTRWIHLSGCAKGCASPGRAALTIVGSEAGYGMITDGTAADAPEQIVAFDGLPAKVVEIAARIAAEGPRRRGDMPAPRVLAEPVHE